MHQHLYGYGSFGKALITALNEAGMESIKVLMGGGLNEAIDGNDVPIDAW